MGLEKGSGGASPLLGRVLVFWGRMPFVALLTTGLWLLLVPTAQAAPFDILVSYRHQGKIVEFDGTTGDVIGDFATATWPGGLSVAPDGTLYAASYSYTAGESKIIQFSSSGQELNSFAAPPIDGQEFTPLDLAIGPDSMVYFSSALHDRVYRYTPGGVASPNAVFPILNVSAADGIGFGPTGDFFATSGSSIIRYNTTTGVATPFASADNGLFTFGPQGDLFVSSGDGVLRYSGTDGSLIGTFVQQNSGGLGYAVGLSFGPNGDLFVVCDTQPGDTLPSLLEYDGDTGAFVRAFPILTDRSGAADVAFLVVPEPSLLGIICLALMAIVLRRSHQSSLNGR